MVDIEFSLVLPCLVEAKKFDTKVFIKKTMEELE